MARKEGYVVFNEAGNYLGKDFWWMPMAPSLPYVHDRRNLIRREKVFYDKDKSAKPQYARRAIYNDSSEPPSVTLFEDSIELNGSFDLLRKRPRNGSIGADAKFFNDLFKASGGKLYTLK